MWFVAAAGFSLSLLQFGVPANVSAGDPVNFMFFNNGAVSNSPGLGIVFYSYHDGIHDFNSGHLTLSGNQASLPTVGKYQLAVDGVPTAQPFGHTARFNPCPAGEASRDELEIFEATYATDGAMATFSFHLRRYCNGLIRTNYQYAEKATTPVSWFGPAWVNDGDDHYLYPDDKVYKLFVAGNRPVTFGAVNLTGPDAHMFTVVHNGCLNVAVIPGQTCAVRLRLTGTLSNDVARNVSMTATQIHPYPESLIFDVGGVIPSYTPITGSSMHTINPERLLDTRTANGVPSTAKLGAKTLIRVQIAGRGSIPADATGVILNLTVTGPTAPSYVTVWPSGAPMPVVSNINFLAGNTIANLQTLALGVDGALNLLNDNGETHVIIDVVGWLRKGGLEPGTTYHPVTPVRVVDTRFSNIPLLPGESRDFRVHSNDSVPGSRSAVLVNITAVAPTAATYLSAHAPNKSAPNASTLNVARAETRANLAVVELGDQEDIRVSNSGGRTNVIIDVLGYFLTNSWVSSGRILVLSPFRWSDTRNTKDAFAALDYGGYEFPPTLDDGVTEVGGIIFNATVTNPTQPGYMTMFPWDVDQIPYVSTSNYVRAQTVANHAWVRLGTEPNNYVGVYNGSKGTIDVILDVQAVFLK